MTLEELLEGFELFDSWEERYRYIIELGRSYPALDAGYKNEENRVDGCVSQVWMVSEVGPEPDKSITIRADSDSHIVRGLIAILLFAYSGKTAESILAVDIDGVFGQLGLEQHLSPNRRNGFFSMVERIRLIAATA